jgi:hypothetical protein
MPRSVLCWPTRNINPNLVRNNCMSNNKENDGYIEPIPKASIWKNNVKPRPLPENCIVDQPDILPENSSRIELTRGLFALVDNDMVENLNRFSWSAAPDYRTCYALTVDANGNNIRMHRHILRVNLGVKVHIDHINGNGLDNRRCNLRIVTHSENQMNRRPKKKTKNRFKGVVPGMTKDFQVLYKIDGKRKKKNFTNEVEAARFYDDIVMKHYKPGSKTNLSLGKYTPEELASFKAEEDKKIQLLEDKILATETERQKAEAAE